MPRGAPPILICLIAFHFLAADSLSAAKDGTLVRLPIKSKKVLETLLEQGVEILTIGRDGRADAVVTEEQLGRLGTMGVPLTVLGRPGDAMATAELDANLGLYHTYAEMQAELSTLTLNHPSLTDLQIVGTSVEGRNIYALKISDNAATDESEPEVLIMGTLHARELMATEIPLRFAMYLLGNYGSDAEVTDLVNTREIFVLPMINPDGHVYVELNHIGINWWSWWRKNRRDNGDGSFGVDLNRNFGYEWGYDNIGSSPFPSSNLYRGPSAFSEPETQTVRDFCNSREFTLGFSYHSYGELLLLPWSYDYLYTDDHAAYIALGDTLAGTNGYFVGNPAMGAIYIVNGGSDDWAYGEDVTKPPFFLYTPEVNTSEQGGFGPPDALIQPTFDLLLPMNMTLLAFADNPQRATGPFTPTMRPIDISGLPIPQYQLSWTGADPSDPNTPVGYELVEYKNLTTIAQDGANSVSPLWHYDGFTVSTARAFEGSGSYYSGEIDNNSSTLELAMFYRVTSSTQDFGAQVWYDIENGWDYAYLEVSTDGGLLWSSVAGNITTNSDPQNNNLGNGITGSSSGWVTATFSLAAYMGQDVRLRWNYVTDESVTKEGLYVDVPGPMPSYEALTVVASGITATDYVIAPTADGDYTYLVRAMDAENQHSLWSNSVDRTVNTATGIAGAPAFTSALGRNFPNPFNPATTIPYTVGSRDGKPVSVRLAIYDIAGRRVSTLVNGTLPPGTYESVWRGHSDAGMALPSGVYFSRLTVAGRTLTRKLAFLK